MAGQSWSVNIDPTSDPDVSQFNPDIFGVPAGSPLQAQKNDLVSWNNRTPTDHNLKVGAEQFPVSPKKSTTAYQVRDAAGVTITYTCSLHPDEEGTIEVVS